MRLVLIRHGQSEHSVRDLVAGPRGCTGLTDLGRQQADKLRRRFAAEGGRFDTVLSSPVRRAEETAAILQPAVAPGTGITADIGLCEMDPGEGDGLSTKEFALRYGSFDPRSQPDRRLSPGGDSWNSFRTRVTDTMATLALRHRNKRIAAVTHAGFIVLTLLELFAIPRPGTGTQVDPDFTSLTEWEFDETRRCWRLVRFNDVAHLAASPRP